MRHRFIYLLLTFLLALYVFSLDDNEVLFDSHHQRIFLLGHIKLAIPANFAFAASFQKIRIQIMLALQ
ncbi:hypothetical protein DP117_23935 [Brasilonema sp. UFV-L1]|nr:hypothetical protein [Brasilonema sp. UFV-L1]